MHWRCEFPPEGADSRASGGPSPIRIRVIPPLMTGLCQEIKVMLYAFYKVIERSSQECWNCVLMKEWAAC